MRGTCSIDDCQRMVVAIGYCDLHYRRYKKHGDPLYTTRIPPRTHPVCIVPGCGRKHLCGGYCNRHYIRKKKYGDPSKLMFAVSDRGAPLKWLREVAIQYRGAECLVYPFARMKKGYGMLWIGGKLHRAHRFVCETAHGPPPPGDIEAAHLCGDARCVNPTHLKWKTPKENAADKISHGTHRAGEDVPSARLTWDDVARIRQLAGAGMRHEPIAEIFGVSRSNVSNIIRGDTWKA